MKTFKITKNSQYIQSIQLDKGTYTYSCNVKSDATVLVIAFQNVKGVWTDFEIPILSGMWNKKAKLTFELKERAVNFDLCKYASDESRVYVQVPMLEEGTNDSTPKPSDLDDLEEIDNNKSQIKAFNLAFEDLENYIDGAFKDGVIDSAEATTIAQLIKTVESERDKMLATYDKLFLNSYLEGTAKSSLQQNKITFIGAVNDVITAINTAIADNKITPTERTNVNNKFNAYKTALADFSTSIENANKAIQDKLKGYSDDAQSSADQAQQKANQAQSDATNANAKLADIASDSKITPSEKQETKKEWDVIEAEFWLNLAQAGNAGVDTENYSDSFVNLQDYIPPLLSDLNATSDINGEQFRQVFVAYYTARTDLLNGIAIKIKGIADNAQSDADLAKSQAQALTYLKDALALPTVQQGGLVLTSFIAARNNNGVVKSFMNGAPEVNPTAFAAGVANFGAPSESHAIALNHDGSGHLANGAISWNADGSVTKFTGGIQSNNMGDKVTISPTNRAISFIDANGTTRAYMGFYNTGEPHISVGNIANNQFNSTLKPNALEFNSSQGNTSKFSRDELTIRASASQAPRFQVMVSGTSTYIIINNLVATGKGSLYEENGFLKIVK